MKVSELMRELSKHDPDAPVLVRVESSSDDDVFTDDAAAVVRNRYGKVVVENRL